MKRLLFIIAALLTFQGVWGQSYSVTMPTGSLEAWYPFCADVTDHGNVGYDLVGTNTSLDTNRFNHKNSAQRFNGLNSDIRYTTFFSMTGGFAYSCWIYAEAAQNSVIVYNGNPSLDGMGMIMDNGFGGNGSCVSLLVGGIIRPITSAPLSLKQWHNVAFVRSGNAYILYVDFVQVNYYAPTTTPTFPGFNTPTTVFQIGADVTLGNRYFNGKIDDVAIYSRLLVLTELKRLGRFKPDINFNLGNDTAVAPDTIRLPIAYNDTSLLDSFIIPIYTYAWTTIPGPGIPFSTDSVNNVVPPSGAGTKYVLEITRPIRDNFGNITDADGTSCVGRDTINIAHIKVFVDLGNDTTFCRGNSLTLRVPPPVAGESYHWSNGSTADTIVVNTSGTYFVTIDSVFTDSLSNVITAKGSDTIRVLVPDSITVSLGGNDTLCTGGTKVLYSLDSATYGPNATYLWSGPPSVGGATTPVVTATVTGTYIVQVTDSSCVTLDTMHLIIIYDSVTVYNNDTAICAGGNIVTIASFDPLLHYQWTPTAGIPSSTNPATTITPDTSAWYVLTATYDSVTKCVARDSFYIDVQPNPYVYAGGNRFVCTHDTIRITPTIIPAWYTHYAYDWSPGNFIDDSTSATVIFTPGDTTNLVLVVTTPAGCMGKDSAMIYTHDGDFASLSSTIVLCPGDSAQLMPLSTELGTTTYVWHPATNIDDSTASNPWIHPVVSEHIIGVATSIYGCKDTVLLDVVVKPAAIISLRDSVTIYPGESYSLAPESNGSMFSWTPPAGLTDTSIINPVATPAVSTKYVLTARTEDGCVVKDSINIRLDAGSMIVVPNAFTPGSGTNSRLKVFMTGIAKLRYFRVYNRYGNLVHEATDIEDTWDGTYNGAPQPLGVYVYEAQAVTDKGIVLKKQGNITLLR